MKNPLAMIRLPMTALFQEKNVTSVWLLESGVVRLVPVQIGATSENDVLIAGGIKPGQAVVTAGVNLLKAGQKVTVLGATAAASANPDGAAK
jgi:hypothetical protein